MQDEKEKPSQVDAQPDKPVQTGGGEKAKEKAGASEAEAKPDADEAPEEEQSPT